MSLAAKMKKRKNDGKGDSVSSRSSKKSDNRPSQEEIEKIKKVQKSSVETTSTIKTTTLHPNANKTCPKPSLTNNFLRNKPTIGDPIIIIIKKKATEM